MYREVTGPDDYLAQVEGDLRAMLETIRQVIFEVAPEVEEITEYGMLGYPGLANLAAQKQYVALYVMPAVLALHKDNFPGTSCGKSCLRFRQPGQVRVEALRALLRDVYAARNS